MNTESNEVSETPESALSMQDVVTRAAVGALIGVIVTQVGTALYTKVATKIKERRANKLTTTEK